MVHQWADLFGVLDSFGIKVDDLVEGAETSVVHIGRSKGDVAKGGGFEVAVVFGIEAVVIA